MRFFIGLILISACSHPFKYKYSSIDRDIASVSQVSAVAKIEVQIKEPLIFASGMDSTLVLVKLFDGQGSLLTDVDPQELSLSSSEDVEAKPFRFQQGIYRSEILPRVKSNPIRIKVEWLSKITSPEIILTTTLFPLKENLEQVRSEESEALSVGEVTVYKASWNKVRYTESFSFENMGRNAIVNAHPGSHVQRSFHFIYHEQARQNLSLEIQDSSNANDAHDMNTVMMFFPRNYLPTVEQLTHTLVVTIPTGEKIVFNKNSKEIVEGVLVEGPLDTSKDILHRLYPDIDYRGQGVMLRANARGQSPKLGQYETDKIDLVNGVRGSVEVLIYNGATGQRCRRPKEDFWEPLDVSPIEFKFATDAEFEAYLKKNCGFGLPKL